MSFLPIVSPWFFWPVAALLLAATGWTLLKNRGTAGWHAGSQNTKAARWRLAALVVLVVLAAARPGLAGASAVQVPASGARGITKTMWLLDQAAAAKVPAQLIRREH